MSSGNWPIGGFGTTRLAPPCPATVTRSIPEISLLTNEVIFLLYALGNESEFSLFIRYIFIQLYSVDIHGMLMSPMLLRFLCLNFWQQCSYYGGVSLSVPVRQVVFLVPLPLCVLIIQLGSASVLFNSSPWPITSPTCCDVTCDSQRWVLNAGEVLLLLNHLPFAQSIRLGSRVACVFLV